MGVDLRDLSIELAGLRQELAGVVDPAGLIDQSTPRGPAAPWCTVHDQAHPAERWDWEWDPKRELGRRCRPRPVRARDVGALVASTLTATAPPSNGGRGIPGSRPPLTGPALHALEVSEAIDRAVCALADAAREALGDVWRHRDGARALTMLPDLVDRLPNDHPLRHRVPATLLAQRQRARDVVGRSRSILWLGHCPTTYEEPFDVLTRVDGQLVTLVGEVGCWTLDHAAMVDAGGEREIWRRSRLGMPRDEQHPPVRCMACGLAIDPASVEISDMVIEHLQAQAAGSTHSRTDER